MTTGAGVVSVGDTRSWATATVGEDMDMDGTTHGDGTVGAGATTDGDGTLTGVTPESVLAGEVTTEIAGAVHTEDTMAEDMPITEVEEDTVVQFVEPH